ncbi:hypothetical protein N6L24_11765 [Cognatishimia sp. SS12]|uniref:hypothetical protein n=1 Tax=Cognatishimia sp. SS12 TaxID=2979465 RepID=UPI00232B9BF8|nr:hypothetical protein [Cognatishimia sp. SS12]MDC0738956.1 hypothetical protein [Cognatishimia sp. SS12]
MKSNKSPSAKGSTAQTREERLKAALKANMGRRKAQAKARSAQDAGDEAENKSKGQT